MSFQYRYFNFWSWFKVQGSPTHGSTYENKIESDFYLKWEIKFKLFYARMLPFSTAVICHTKNTLVPFWLERGVKNRNTGSRCPTLPYIPTLQNVISVILKAAILDFVVCLHMWQASYFYNCIGPLVFPFCVNIHANACDIFEPVSLKLTLFVVAWSPTLIFFYHYYIRMLRSDVYRSIMSIGNT